MSDSKQTDIIEWNSMADISAWNSDKMTGISGSQGTEQTTERTTEEREKENKEYLHERVDEFLKTHEKQHTLIDIEDETKIQFETSTGTIFGVVQIHGKHLCCGCGDVEMTITSKKNFFYSVELDIESIKLLKQLYEYDCVSLIDNEWLDIQLDDGHYGLPEYKYTKIAK